MRALFHRQTVAHTAHENFLSLCSQIAHKFYKLYSSPESVQTDRYFGEDVL